MKTILFTIALVSAIAPINAQITHTLIAADHYFEPDTLYISPGDSVDVDIIGYHSATEIDSIDWVGNIDNPNGGFDVGFGAPEPGTKFAINTAGTYYYICEPHSDMGMKGIIIVGESAGIEEEVTSNNFAVFQSNANTINITYSDVDQLDIFDVNGQLIQRTQLLFGSTATQIEIDFETGLYLLSFSKNGSVVGTEKLVVR